MITLCWTTCKINATFYIQLSCAGIFSYFIHSIAGILSRVSFVHFEDCQVSTVFQVTDLVVPATSYLSVVFGPADLYGLCSSDMTLKVSTFSHHSIHRGQGDVKEGWVLSLYEESTKTRCQAPRLGASQLTEIIMFSPQFCTRLQKF